MWHRTICRAAVDVSDESDVLLFIVEAVVRYDCSRQVSGWFQFTKQHGVLSEDSSHVSHVENLIWPREQIE